MRAAVLECPAPVETRPLRIVERPRPRPGRGDVLVRVSVCGLCRTDLHVVEGELAPRRQPIVPGHQIVGEVVELGDDVTSLALGARVGIPWLHRTCGACRFCTSERENLCEAPELTGWTVDGGFAEYVTAPAAFTYALPRGIDDHHVAPLLCAGIIGYRCLRTTGLDARGWSGARLGIYGFGAAGHVAIQIARARGAEVYVCTRDEKVHRTLALELGATWVGGTLAAPPVALDAAIVFAPAGEIVPAALAAVDRGATLVLGGIHMSPIPSFGYELLYQERVIRSVANNTRVDGREFLAEAERVGVRTHVQRYAFERLGDAVCDLKLDAVRGAAVIDIAGPQA
jgi:propanol-preferring alcohol dehydrogenase